MNGWVLIDRKILDWGWWDDADTTKVWLTLLLLASWKDDKWHGEDVPRGSLITSYESLSRWSKVPVRKVRTALSRLESTGEITRKVTNKFQLITVEKYSLYQDIYAISDKQLTNERQTTDNQLTINRQSTDNQLTTSEQSNNINNTNNINKINKKRVGAYTPELQDAIREFKNMRVRMKKPMTDESVKRFLNKLEKLADTGEGFDEGLAVKIIHQSIDSGWTGLYEYKGDDIGNHKLSGQRTSDGVSQGDKGTEPRPTERQAETHLRGIRMAKVGDFGKTHSENTGTGTDEQKPVADAYRDRE